MAEKFELTYVTFELPNDVSHISQRAFQFDSKKVLNGQLCDVKSGRGPYLSLQAGQAVLLHATASFLPDKCILPNLNFPSACPQGLNVLP